MPLATCPRTAVAQTVGGHPVTVAEQIKTLRAKHQLTVAQLADSLGVSPRTVESWEQGRRVPSGVVRKLLRVVYPHSASNCVPDCRRQTG